MCIDSLGYSPIRRHSKRTQLSRLSFVRIRVFTYANVKKDWRTQKLRFYVASSCNKCASERDLSDDDHHATVRNSVQDANQQTQKGEIELTIEIHISRVFVFQCVSNHSQRDVREKYATRRRDDRKNGTFWRELFVKTTSDPAQWVLFLWTAMSVFDFQSPKILFLCRQ